MLVKQKNSEISTRSKVFATQFSVYSGTRSVETECLSPEMLFVFQSLAGFRLGAERNGGAFSRGLSNLLCNANCIIMTKCEIILGCQSAP